MIGSSLKRLRISNFKLNILLDITQAINENLPTRDLLSRFEQVLTKELNIGKVVVYNFNKGWERVLCSGISPDLISDIDVEKDIIHIKEITNLPHLTESKFKYFDLVIPVFHKDYPLAFVLIGDIEEEREGISPTIKHLHFIQTLTNIIIVAIENKRLFKDNLKQEAIKKELELARKMQEMLIPNKEDLPHNEKLYVDAFYLPHFEVGGDYYDFIPLSDTEVGFCIADVSGKGISAAILMSNFQASLRALFTSDISLTELIRKLNKIVLRNTKGERFITLFLAKYNYKTKELEFINAGHNPPLLYFSSMNLCSYLKNGCPGLGMLDEIIEINKGSLKIIPNTKLVCYTDGLVELENEENVEYGTKPLEDFIKKDIRIDETVISIIESLNIYRGNKTFFDDVSIIGLEFR